MLAQGVFPWKGNIGNSAGQARRGTIAAFERSRSGVREGSPGTILLTAQRQMGEASFARWLQAMSCPQRLAAEPMLPPTRIGRDAPRGSFYSVQGTGLAGSHGPSGPLNSTLLLASRTEPLRSAA